MKKEIILRRHDLILMPLKLFILETWKENFEKGNPNLGITTLFRSHKPVDVIILTQENRGHPLPRYLGGLAQGNSTL
jgi:hypothetical protein